MVKKLMEDTREIRYIYTINKGSYNVGGDVGQAEGVITSIKPYEENGNGAPVVFLAVYVDGELYTRINSLSTENITYYLDNED